MMPFVLRSRLVCSAIAFGLAASFAPLPAQSSAAAETTRPQTFVIVHGAWGGGWAFKEVEGLLRARGHVVYRPTLTGQGERVHHAHPDIDLNTHITDIVNVLLWEELEDVVLVGHSYGGMVITGVADRVHDRLKQIIYLDAALPVDGESLFEAFGDVSLPIVDGFIPAGADAASKPVPHDVPHPAKTATQDISLQNQDAVAKIPATYVLFAEPGKEPFFRRFYARAEERGWEMFTMESDHNAQWSRPKELADLLHKIVAE